MPERLENRLEDSVVAWVATLPALNGWVIVERDEDGKLQADGEPPKPVVITVAKDRGRFHKLLPIRNVNLELRLRANSKLAGGSAADFSAACGALEAVLDGTNLVAAWSTTTIAVMLAVRPDEIGIRMAGLVREAVFTLDCKCVAAELTTQGSGVVVG